MDNDINHFIQRRLDEDRPDRYQVGDTTWRETIYIEVESMVNIVEARQIAARSLVDRMEGNATRGANDLMRRIGRTEQWPLDWFDVAARPIAVGAERIRLASATPDDFNQWAIEERRVATADYEARIDACKGAEWIAAQMVAAGYATFGQALQGEVAA